MSLRLGLDIGTNSIGWALLRLDEAEMPIGIEAMGSRIFSDGRNPKDKTSLAVGRRLARQARRRRDRFLERKRLLFNELVRLNLFPKDKAEQEDMKNLDVLAVRAKAAQRPIARHDFGRVLYHLNMKRAFKSGRKEDKEAKKNKLTERIAQLEEELAKSESKTYGEFLQQRRLAGFSTRATIETGIYAVRKLLEAEFDHLVSMQRSGLPDITDDQWSRLRDIIFWQRPLKPVERGNCLIYGMADSNNKGEKRAPRYLPSFEQYRFLSDLANLRYRDEKFQEIALTPEQRQHAFEKFKNNANVTFKALRKELKIPTSFPFTVETRDKLSACPTAAFFAKKTLFGTAWATIPLQTQDEIADFFFSEEDEKKLREALERLVADSEIIGKLMESNVPSRSEMTGSLSSRALREIVARSLEEAREPSKILHDLLPKETGGRALVDELPYYGRAIPESVQPIPQHIKNNGSHIDPEEREFGRIANPTVHIGLNQLRRVINDLVARFGKPEAIHIEFARDLKMSQDQKAELAKSQKKNEERNTQVDDFIRSYGLIPSSFNREKVKLWFEIEDPKDRVCIYSGRAISQRLLLSEEVEVDHILPFSRTLDDRLTNKVLVMASENRLKKNRAPYEAFDENRMLEIYSRIRCLPESKQRQFESDAMKRFGEENNWLARQLTDTSYLAKHAKKYLGTLVEDRRIVVSPGRITALLRGKWGLNKVLSDDGSKNRDDHRHHAVDALVVALTDRSKLQNLASKSEEARGKIKIDLPWEGFHTDVKGAVDQIVTSHKLDHGKQARLIEETCYGLVKNPGPYETENNYRLVTRTTVDKITDKSRSTIRSPELRGMEQLPSKTKRVRVLKVARDQAEIGSSESTWAEVRHGRNSQHYKYYEKGETFSATFWRMPDGGIEVRYIKYFDADRDPNSLKPHPAAKILFKLHKQDSVALEIDGSRRLFRIASIKPSSGQFEFVALNEAMRPEGQSQFLRTFSKLRELKFRKVHVTPTGKIIDRGCVL